MKKSLTIFILAIAFIFINSCRLQVSEYYFTAPEYLTDLVNPLMGSDSEPLLSNGNTYPTIALPRGMNFWTPQTGKMGSGWIYSYKANKINGIRQTHQPSPWINDYGAFSFMPVTGNLKFTEEERASWFSHKSEVVKPYYYSVYLADHDTKVELIPSERAAILRFTFPKTDSAFIVLDAFFKGSAVKIIPSERKITGYARNNAGGVPGNFHNYFTAVFDKDFVFYGTWDESKFTFNSTERDGQHTGAVIGFKTKRGEKVHVKTASSFISPEQAELNLEREIGQADFETIKTRGKEAWEKELSRIRIKGGSYDQQRIFYSCLYRVLLYPRIFYEFDKQGNMMHYSPYNGETLPGYMFTDNGFWDTFRAIFPFFTVMYPEFCSEVMQGLANTYLESGWLPEWASPGHRACMIGSNSASIIGDSYLKGIRGFDMDLLYEAIIKNTKGHGPVPSVGRYGADYYNELGYIPYDVGINENAARTLEYAYADYVIMKLAKKLGKPEEEIQLFKKRADNYMNLFDPETRLMRGKNKDGTFQSPFDPFKWGDAFTEGNSWHYTWSVFHDIPGLIDLMGGNEAFCKMLDSVFILPPVYDESYYGRVIHEIREMQISNMGQYAHGNQPIQHMLYLYNYAGQPWKTQYWAREVMNRMYTPGPDGYCGDEDNGQTSAWYVLSALGFYPVCPGQDVYILGSPLFEEVSLSLPDNKVLIIKAQDNSMENKYIESVLLNGKAINRNYLYHNELISGGEVEFRMSAKPDLLRGIKPDAFPKGMSDEDY